MITQTSPYKKKNPARKRPDPIDVYVGKQIRKIRRLRGMTQSALAKAVGVEFQQIQKYESGYNRTSASRLVKIAEALDTTPGALLGKYAGNQLVEDVWNDRRVIKMIRAYEGLPVEIQSSIHKMITEVGKISNPANPPR